MLNKVIAFDTEVEEWSERINPRYKDNWVNALAFAVGFTSVTLMPAALNKTELEGGLKALTGSSPVILGVCLQEK